MPKSAASGVRTAAGKSRFAPPMSTAGRLRYRRASMRRRRRSARMLARAYRPAGVSEGLGRGRDENGAGIEMYQPHDPRVVRAKRRIDREIVTPHCAISDSDSSARSGSALR